MIDVSGRVCRGEGRFSYPHSFDSSSSWAPRPACGRGAAPSMAPMPYTWSGPAFKGMDPSDPLTYVRPWNPQPGMIAYLNFDGAALQASTPTQLQRGPQQRRPRRLRVSP